MDLTHHATRPARDSRVDPPPPPPLGGPAMDQGGRPVNVVILLGGRPMETNGAEYLSTPRMLVNVGGKAVIQWLLESVRSS